MTQLRVGETHTPSEEGFLGWCDMGVGFSNAYNRARDQKLGVSARQLAAGNLPLTGTLTTTQAVQSGTPLVHNGSAKTICIEGEGDLSLCNALDGA
jgi:hypothetical protein